MGMIPPPPDIFKKPFFELNWKPHLFLSNFIQYCYLNFSCHMIYIVFNTQIIGTIQGVYLNIMAKLGTTVVLILTKKKVFSEKV